RPAQVPYGYRRSDGLLVPHLSEQRVIQSVRKMSSDGLTYRQICDFLTSVGVPTKSQGKGWNPEMIRRLLSRSNILQPGADACLYIYNMYNWIVQFEWDESKNQQNIRKHGISFEEAQTVFFDPLAKVAADPDHSKTELRFLAIGHSSNHRLLLVVHC